MINHFVLQIVTFGMNDRVGPISFPLKKKEDFGKKPYSDKLARMIDEVCGLFWHHLILADTIAHKRRIHSKCRVYQKIVANFC